MSSFSPSPSLLLKKAMEEDFRRFFDEDDLSRNFRYIQSLPQDEVKCQLFFKSDMVIAGLPFFFEAFRFLGAEFSSAEYSSFLQKEGQEVTASKIPQIEFSLPFSLALTGERIALNLLQHASSIATATRRFVEIASPHGISILDTRKTTPGLRSLEKYAVTVGGGNNHRLGQADMWMIKDNHKNFFGGIANALAFFREQKGFYTPIEVEIHDLKELQEVAQMGIKHFMLDNFTPDQVREAVKQKVAGSTYEISGGIRLETLESYCLPGVDAISVGAITYDAPHMDISFKYQRSK